MLASDVVRLRGGVHGHQSPGCAPAADVNPRKAAMPSSTPANSHMTIAIEPALPERFSSLRAFIAHRVHVLPRPAKVIAADMDISPSLLSRKLNPTDADTQRFNLDDLEAFLACTGEAAAVVEYLAAKYLDSDDARRARALARVERLAADLSAAMAALKESAE